MVEPLARYCRENVICDFIEKTKIVAAKESQESTAFRQQQLQLQQALMQQAREKTETSNRKSHHEGSSQKHKDRERGRTRDKDKERDRERERASEKSREKEGKESAETDNHRRRRGGHSSDAQGAFNSSRRGPPAGVIDQSDEDEPEANGGAHLDSSAIVAENQPNRFFEQEFPPLPGTTKGSEAGLKDGSTHELTFVQALAKDQTKSSSSIASDKLLVPLQDLDSSFNDYPLNSSVISDLDPNRPPPPLFLANHSHSQLIDSQQTFYEDDLDDVVFQPFARALPPLTQPLSAQPEHFSSSISRPPTQPPPLISVGASKSSSVAGDVFSSLGITRNTSRLGDYSALEGETLGGSFGGIFGDNSSHLDSGWHQWGATGSTQHPSSGNGGSFFESTLNDRNIITNPNSTRNSANHLSDMYPAESFSMWDKQPSFGGIATLSDTEAFTAKHNLNVKLAQLEDSEVLMGDQFAPSASYIPGRFPSDRDLPQQQTSQYMSFEGFPTQQQSIPLMAPPPGFSLHASSAQFINGFPVSLPPGFALNSGVDSSYSNSNSAVQAQYPSAMSAGNELYGYFSEAPQKESNT